MNLRQAAEMALEALEKMSPETDTLVEVAPHVWEYRGSLVIQALRQALAQPDEVLAEREACAKVCLEGTDMPVQVDALKIIRAERERIANAIRARGNDLQTAIERGTEAWADVPDATEWVEELRGNVNDWVGLTDYEIWDIGVDNQRKGGGFWGYPRAIEAKLKEKNT
jgi:hypothetical protein